MSYTNFFVSENNLTKKYKGCLNPSKPTAQTVGTLSGEWLNSPISNIVPFESLTVPGLWIFGAYQDQYFKMVGIQYGNGSPKRVDGRAKEVSKSNQEKVNSSKGSMFWDTSNIKGITEQEYNLTISNNSPLQSVNQCMETANQNGNSVFGISNLDKNGMTQCVNNNEIPDISQLGSESESQCLGQIGTSTIYNINSGGNENLGKSYMGVKKDKSSKFVFHEYPSSLLGISNRFHKVANYDSPENNLTNADITDTTSEQCKQYCLNRGQQCKGIVYDRTTNSCTLKGEIYPKSKREINKSKDIYTRMPSVKNSKSCPGGIEAVDSQFLNKNGFISSENMTTEFQCETEAMVAEEEGLEKAYRTLTEEVGGLRKENEQLINDFNEVRKSVMTNANDYVSTEEKINKLRNNPTVLQLLSDSEKLQTMFSMRNTGLVLALILLSIFLLKVLRK